MEGAVALFEDDGTFIKAMRMPIVGAGRGREVDLALVRGMLEAYAPKVVGLETVHSMPKQGVASTCTTCRGHGELKGLLCGLHIPCQPVLPQRWVKKFVGQKKLTYAERKAESVKVARYRWPELPIKYKRDWGMADASWIALYAWREFSGPGVSPSRRSRPSPETE